MSDVRKPGSEPVSVEVATEVEALGGSGPDNSTYRPVARQLWEKVA